MFSVYVKSTFLQNDRKTLIVRSVLSLRNSYTQSKNPESSLESFSFPSPIKRKTLAAIQQRLRLSNHGKNDKITELLIHKKQKNYGHLVSCELL